MTTLTGALDLPISRVAAPAATGGVSAAVDVVFFPALPYHVPPAMTAPRSTTMPAIRATLRLRSLRSCSARIAAARRVRFCSRLCFDIASSSGRSGLGCGLGRERPEQQGVEGERRPRPPDEQQRERQQSGVPGDLPGVLAERVGIGSAVTEAPAVDRDAAAPDRDDAEDERQLQ